jgi:hypothetical protein
LVGPDQDAAPSLRVEPGLTDTEAGDPATNDVGRSSDAANLRHRIQIASPIFILRRQVRSASSIADFTALAEVTLLQLFLNDMSRMVPVPAVGCLCLPAIT